MSLKLSVFTSKEMRQYSLPLIDNIDYELILDREIFGFKQNVIVLLDNIDGKWRFKKSRKYEILNDNSVSPSRDINSGGMFTVRVTGEELIKISVSDEVVQLDSFKKYAFKMGTDITIGRNDDNVIQYDFQKFIGRQHAVITVKKGDVFIVIKSKNGAFVNGKRVTDQAKLHIGDIIDIYGLKIILLKGIIAVNTGADIIINEEKLDTYISNTSKNISGNKRDYNSEKRYFHRAPRKIEKIYREEVEIETPPELRSPEKRPLILTIGPSLTMAVPMLLGCGMAIIASRTAGMASGVFMYTGIITAVGSAIIGTIWTIANLRYAGKQFEEAEKGRFAAYSEYLVESTDKIRDMYNQNVKSMETQYPSAQICSEYDEKSSLLWNRNSVHDDMMFYRIGLGDIPFQVDINIPKRRFKIEIDDLEKKPALIRDEFKTLYNIPRGIDLFENRLVGIVGGKNKKGAFDLVKCISAQIAASNSYTDVKMAFVYDSKNENHNQWQFTKWFPHTWTEGKKERLVASNKNEASELFFSLTNILRTRAEESEDRHGEHTFIKPHYVLFIENMSWLQDEPIAKYIYDNKESYGLTTVLMSENYENLPNSCSYILYNNGEISGIYSLSDADDHVENIAFDNISSSTLDKFARKLIDIEIAETEVGGDIPSSLTFFEMYKVSHLDDFNVIERWKKNRTYDSMKALIGRKAGDMDCYLDIHEKYHGPHGLVAGTTGSGKSETLQTYMLSLAINFSPYDIAFFVIDFKGGGMANLFENLPHSIGSISNLSGNQVRRAMISIKSENKRRQKIFRESGVNNINNYTKLLKNNEVSTPVPHLFIIIDEFAELKKEEPEFMKELISVAQVGRSLGVHLILATQKPSGTVDDNIWSNSKFRLCLRVQDRQDSNDMLHKPDAAYITQAGRGYLQVGNDEVYECFQSGWSGAVYNDDDSDNKTEIAEMIGLGGKTEFVGGKIKSKISEKKKRNWIINLINTLYSTLEAKNMTINDYIPGSAVADDIIQSVIVSLQNNKYRYDNNAYTCRRLNDFIELFKSVEEESPENMADEIISLAAHKNVRLPEVKDITQLDAIVEYLHTKAIENGYQKSMNLWLPVLPRRLYLNQLTGYEEVSNTYKEINKDAWELEAYIGLYDDPANQAQEPVILDFAENGHHAICGTAISGKSIFMQTAIYSLINRYSPQYVNFYLFDFSNKMLSAFEDSNHVGEVMYENDLDKIDICLTMLGRILDERKELFRGGGYAQYVRSHGITMPSIFICIDNYGGFRNKTSMKYDDFMLKLSTEGAGYGIYLLFTAGGYGTTDIPTKIGDNIKASISLEMSDKFKYGDVLKTMHFDVMPEKNVRGRGLMEIHGQILEFQTALSVEAQDDYSRLEKIKQRCKELNRIWDGPVAKKVPTIPKNPVWNDIARHSDYAAFIADDTNVPVAYNESDASLYCINLRDIYTYVVLGRKKTGKTTVIKNIACAFQDKDSDVCVVDNDSNEMRKFSEDRHLHHVVADDDLKTYLDNLIDEFINRNTLKKKLISEGRGINEVYDEMKHTKRIVVIINNLMDFIHKVENLEGSKYDYKGVMENLFDKGYMHNIYFVAGIEQDNVNEMVGKRMYNYFVNDTGGVLLGGSPISQKIFDFNDLSFAEQNKPYKPGTGLTHNEDGQTIKIVIPKYDEQ